MKRTKKLAILSDLHLDVNQFDTDTGAAYLSLLIQTLQDEKITDLHLAGDMSNDFKTVTQPFLRRLSDAFEVSYNLGNHDMLGLTESEITENDFVSRQIGEKKLLSFAGWYDYSFCPETTFEQNLRTKNTFWFDRKIKRDADDLTVTNRVLTQLDRVLSEMTSSEIDRLIVAMHFVPNDHFLMTHPKFVRFNAFLGAQRFHDIFIKHGVKDVVFGHNHRSYDEVIDGVHYQAKPLGYKREWHLINDYLAAFPKYGQYNSYNLHKRYNLLKKTAEFDSFLLTHFPEEVKKSLVIFEL
ncbi:metallophosphoesterase [Lactococcus insecticola]|uniref:Phosphoesterase n=1 Tax=Pseudolactococcus insecticola TaxID=2709158 RepID=A0A6A0B6B6_9LACT|nr:metallophosphoesterase [Lactococcus insecticola]GFH40048.1 phosphoesterase [Lactococcus insecticola]